MTALAANSKTNEKIPNARICHEMDLQSFMVLKKKFFFALRTGWSAVAWLFWLWILWFCLGAFRKSHFKALKTKQTDTGVQYKLRMWYSLLNIICLRSALEISFLLVR